ncbi:MAG: hemolysin family protein [Gemmatimonadales bacterium]|nr:hemolysin family protein [Gemmatimonadales bacterium]MDZ4388984.1 hemolysin family protein [Gemmatimonadales bacterium]
MQPPIDWSSIVIGLTAVVALVGLNAFFVAAEFALVGARRTRLEELAQSGDRKATLALRAVQHLDRYISATQLGITVASLGLGWIGKPALAGLLDWFFALFPSQIAVLGTHTVAVAVAFTIISILHIVLGELVPKALALLYPEGVSRWVVWPLMGFTWVMHAPIMILNGTANRLLALAGVEPPSEHHRLHSPEEIRILVEQSGEGGSLDRSNARLLEGVFEFSEKTAEEVMTPRTEMSALAADLTVEAAADIVATSGRSRYPVYAESLDEITGVIHAKEILRALRQQPGMTIRHLSRPPLFVPGTREVEDVLADMKRLKTHLAVVLDEYGGTAGLVTMEDLLEEIVGEILDEYDPVEQAAQALDDGSATLDGATPIADFNSQFEADLDDSDYTTLGGFLFGQLGRLPKEGDRVSAGAHLFEITSMAGRRVDRVKVILTP